ncbi:hypothetical protein [Streptomyces sp. NPDC088725]|uniref:hypothetical protein n=1 Tax=Streptomyces sp. NPDC088725 TaxID=3365873 RepID=UPI0038040BDA
MADERDKWLDKATAERLLRGEPVEVAGGHARRRAEGLAGALRGLAHVTYANDTETPGEAAALTAFRRARVATGPRDKAPETHAEREAAAELPGTVRLAPVSRALPVPFFRGSLGRGFVAAAAACALCTVAVAVGTGVLGNSSFSKRDPLPANSVSPVETLSPAPLLSRETGSPHASAPSDPPSAAGTEAGTATEAGRPPRSGQGFSATRESGDNGAGGEAPAPGRRPDGPPGKSTNWYLSALATCRDYRSGEIDAARRRELESKTKGPQGAERFCDRLLGRGDGGAGGGAGRGGVKGGDRGEGVTGGGKSGGVLAPSAPAHVEPDGHLSFQPPEPTPTAAPTPTPGAGGGAASPPSGPPPLGFAPTGVPQFAHDAIRDAGHEVTPAVHAGVRLASDTAPSRSGPSPRGVTFFGGPAQ